MAPPPWRLAFALGLAGSALLAAAMFTPAFLPPAHPVALTGLANPAGTLAGRAAVIVAVLAMILGWLGLRRPVLAGAGPKPWQVLLAWSAPMLLVPPVLSADPFLYADQAWTVHHGLNPYLVGLSAAGGPYADQVDPVWRGSTAVYPALSLLTIWASAAIANFDPYWGVIAMRLPAIAGVALLAASLPALARAAGADRAYADWLGLLNPLVVIHLIGGAHNDALMIGLIAVSLRVALLRPGWWAAPLLLGAAVAVKQPAAFAGLAVAFLISERRAGRLEAIAAHPDSTPTVGQWRSAAGWVLWTAAASIAVFAAVSLLSGFGFGWLTSLSLPGAVLSPAPVSVLGQLGVPLFAATWIGRIALLAIVAAAALRFGPANPWRLLVVMLFAVALTGAVLHGWYLAWGTCFLALARFGLLAERIAVALLTTLLVYLTMAEYIGWLVLPQLAIGLAAAVLVDRLAYANRSGYSVAGAPGPNGMPSK